MSVESTLYNIVTNENLINADLKYCLVDYKKRPYKINGDLAHPNNIDDFIPLEDLVSCDNYKGYEGVGVSIQASQISAIDVDKCFAVPFDLTTADDRAKDVINRFKKDAYIEFSYSGTGLRVFFKYPLVENYATFYYIKNSKNKVEFYQPNDSYRYVTITGRTIANNPIIFKDTLKPIITDFLKTYLLREFIKSYSEINNSMEDNLQILLIDVKRRYLSDPIFADAWFAIAPGSHRDESEKDYHLLSLLYEGFTQNRLTVRLLFEQSPYYKSKDEKHIKKWEGSNYRYFNYVFDHIASIHKN